jgi:hypothetical protein
VNRANIRFVMQSKAQLGLLAVVAVACAPVEDEFSITFPSQAALESTSEIAVTAFVPLQTPEDSDTPNFVPGAMVGVFPPTRMIDPETIQTFPNLGTVLRFRSKQPYPFEDASWVMEFGQPDTGDPNNPWGAAMLYIEARGEARTPDKKASLTTATLLAGSTCVRTKEASHPDSNLDKAVKRACRLLADPEGDGEVVSVELLPVAPTEFKLAPCDGRGALAGAKGQELAPGPAVCLDAVSCDNVQGGGGDCFDCQQPSSQCDNVSNVPIVFAVDQVGGNAGPARQVVLTDETGRAQAPIDLDDCTADIRVTAQVLGRSTPPVEYTLECVEAIESFSCEADIQLGEQFMPESVSTVPGIDGQCSPGNVDACAHVAILRDDTMQTRLELWHPDRLDPIVQTFAERTAVAVHGYYYEEPDGLGGPPARPMVAVAVSGRGMNNDTKLRIYVFEFRDGQLIPHDGGTGELPTRCGGWFCQEQGTCTNGTCADGYTCYEGMCVETAEDVSAMCPAPAGCQCEIDGVGFQTRVAFVARDRDDDGLADLTVATEIRAEMLLHLTSTAQVGSMYGSDCECGRYGQTPNAIAMGTFGGDAPDPTRPDLFIGATGGSYLRYATRLENGRSTLQCGGVRSLRDGMSVRDVAAGAFSCPINDPTCNVYDDVFTVAAKNITGGGPDDPGVVRLIYGSPEDLSSGDNDPLKRPGVRLLLEPREIDGRDEPRDPQRVRLGDFNGDQHLDAAVLYRTSGEMHIWLGASNAALGESETGIVVEECAVRRSDTCSPLSEFAAGDFDGNQTTDLAVVCNASNNPTLRFFYPQR